MDERRRRWLALAVASVGIAIISLDTTVLNVSIPTILRDFDTTLPTLQWVITGYALTFASLLIIGGRLADVFGRRRIFVIGAALFGLGSLMAALSQNVPQLIIGEAIVEGVGASLMMPSTLAIISTTFEGNDRIKAFGLWGAAGGASAALGPVVGGFLTSNASWRWSFGLNVIVVPLTVAGALWVIPRDGARKHRQPLDVRGALMIASGMFLLVFALSEGPRHGWFRSLEGFRIGSTTVWPDSMPVSVVVAAIAASAAMLTGFVFVEMARERADASPLFEFSQLRRPTFRFGLATTLALSIGQLGLSFVLPIFLQEGRHLSAQMNGLWQLPSGLSVLVGAQVGSRLAIRFGPVKVLRAGVALGALAFIYVATVLNAQMTFLTLLPGLVMYGVGLACAITQLTGVVLADIDREKSGSAGGANNTAQKVGQSIGVAIIGSLLTSRFASNVVSAFSDDTSLAPEAKAQALQTVRSSGVSFRVPADASAADAARLHHLFVDSLAQAARYPLWFSSAVLVIGLIISTRIPLTAATQQPAAVEEEFVEAEVGLA